MKTIEISKIEESAEIENPAMKSVLAKENNNSKGEQFWFYMTIILSGLLVICFILFYLIETHTKMVEKKYQKELRIQQIQNSISTAVIDVSQTNYETSRQTANDFFTLLESELALEEDSAFSNSQRETMRQVIKKKEVINSFFSR
ncbi:MAG: hypothetical protein HC846_05755 [Blastocatellia bacterium]|nr:hypothetical protein [Blastocatellia bacterium]